MRILLVLTLLAAAVMPLQAQDKVSAPDRQVMARITVGSDLDMQRVMQLGLDLMEYRAGDELIFLTTQEQVNKLRVAGFSVRVDEQLTAELPRPGDTETFNGGYRTVEETFAFLDQLAAQYPHLAQVFTYGQSWEKMRNPLSGYNLTGIKLTNRQTIGSSSKPRFFLQAGIHARELVPPELATRFIQYLLTNYGKDGDATWLLDEHEIIVVPILNPDGRKIAETGLMKRKNTNSTTGNCSGTTTGIDLNRNYSFWWGTVNMPTHPPCGETWPGLSAASEPEIAFEQALLSSLFPDQRPNDRTTPAPLDATGVFLDMHSTGNLVLYPWGEDVPPPNSQLATIANKMAAYNGYNPIQSVQLYPTSGSSKDWAYGELGVAALSTETGTGSGSCGGFMPQYTCLDGGTGGNFWLVNRPVLLYLAKLARTPYMTSQGPTPETLTSTRFRLNRYTVRAQISDESNGGQIVTAAELYVGLPPWRGGTPIAMIPEDGNFNSPNEAAIATVSVAGSRLLYVRGRDSAGNWGVMKAVLTMPRSNTGDN